MSEVKRRAAEARASEEQDPSAASYLQEALNWIEVEECPEEEAADIAQGRHATEALMRYYNH